jgi:OmcA/MtrC family decaheme c-type cytochrome
MRMAPKTLKKAFLFVGFLLISAFAIAAYEDGDIVLTALDKLFYVSAQDALWTRPGLKLEIQNWTIPADRRMVVTFKLTDLLGNGLDRDGVVQPGAVRTSWILAYIPKNAEQYVDYCTRTQTSPITNVKAVQAGTDSGGVYTGLGDGVYTYRFATVLPADYDTTATHTIGVYGTRDLREFGQSFYVVNVTKNFVPNGGAVTKIRNVVSTAACNACHDPLALHGETGRRDVEICILCHQPQSVDPDTGRTVDMIDMVHKIHMGSSLPSVKAGKPYIIIGNSQSVNDYSDIALPKDIRNCTACHKNATQANQWFSHPTAYNCGSCHDDVNFTTGLNHPGGPQKDDRYCAVCHWEQSDWEYDATVKGAHTVPYKSLQLRNPKAEVVSVTNLGPGLKPTVKFKLTDRLGAVVKPTDLARLTLRFAGPTGDYRWYVSETANVAAATVDATGVATYNFTTQVIPATATGSVALEVEGYFNGYLNKGTVKEVAQRDVMDNLIKFYPLPGTTTATPRRTIVDDAKCDNCHEKLWFHGGNRNNAQVCSLCHNPTLTASQGTGLPNQTISLQVMIHRIHTGEEQNGDYKIGGASFKEVLYPGDRRDCLQCHATGTWTVPLPATATPVTWPANAWSPVLPTAAACLGCHDSDAAIIHAYTNTAPFGESCAVCHKEGADAAVGKAHAR